MDAIVMIRMQRTPARLELPRNRGQLSIDQYPSRASYNMKTMLDTTRDDVQRMLRRVEAAERAAEIRRRTSGMRSCRPRRPPS